MTCFLIDDDQDDQEFFTLALSAIDPSIQCTMAVDGIEAIKKFEDPLLTVPDLIFLDMRMPRMSGTETIRQIKTFEHLSNVPTILYSTTDADIGTEEARKAGADYFFTKPTSIPDLSATLSEVFRKFARKP